jgi:hypothetical protein
MTTVTEFHTDTDSSDYGDKATEATTTRASADTANGSNATATTSPVGRRTSTLQEVWSIGLALTPGESS